MTADHEGDGGADGVRCWLVERGYTDRGVVSLTYATPDGERALRRELAPSMLERTTVTAAIDADPEALEPVEDEGTRERYAMEADRVRDTHDPDGAI